MKIAINQYTISIGANKVLKELFMMGPSIYRWAEKQKSSEIQLSIYKAFTYPDKQLHLTEIVLSILNHNGHYLNSRVESEEKKKTQNN